MPEREFDHSPLIRALLDSGYAWEQTVLDSSLAGAGCWSRRATAPCHTRRFDWRRRCNCCASAQPGDLHLPADAAPAAGVLRAVRDRLALVTISDNHPDLIAVLPGDGRPRRLRLIDLKRGESLQLTHRVQVLLYALELDAVVGEAAARTTCRWTWRPAAVWLGGAARRRPSLPWATCGRTWRASCGTT